jgi:hypothetical protein
MTLEELNKLALKYYEKGGDVMIECWDSEEKQEFLDIHGSDAKKEALSLFDMWYHHAEDIRKTAF